MSYYFTLLTFNPRDLSGSEARADLNIVNSCQFPQHIAATWEKFQLFQRYIVALPQNFTMTLLVVQGLLQSNSRGSWHFKRNPQEMPLCWQRRSHGSQWVNRNNWLQLYSVAQYIWNAFTNLYWEIINMPCNKPTEKLQCSGFQYIHRVVQTSPQAILGYFLVS